MQVLYSTIGTIGMNTFNIEFSVDFTMQDDFTLYSGRFKGANTTQGRVGCV